MILSEFIKRYREGVEKATGAAFSVRALADKLGINKERVTKWESRHQGNPSYPKSEYDRIRVKTFFGIENFTDISESSLKAAIARYPNGLANIDDIKNPKPTTIALNPQLGTDGEATRDNIKDDPENKNNEERITNNLQSGNNQLSLPYTNNGQNMDILLSIMHQQGAAALKESAAREMEAEAKLITAKSLDRVITILEKKFELEGTESLHVKQTEV